MKFFFAADGALYENEKNLPLAVVRQIMAKAECLFRFAYDRNSHKIYIQDGSFRKKLSDGDDKSWECLNQALVSLAQDGIVFPARAEGEPPGANLVRKLSEYKAAWRDIGEHMKEELGMKPDDLPVFEHSGDEYDDDVGFSPDGRGNKDDKLTGPMIHLARTKFTNQEGDVDYVKINERLAEFYLENIEKINESDETTKHWLGKRMTLHRDKHGMDPMFALSINGKTRIFRGRGKDGGLLDEAAIRTSESMSPYGGILTIFSVDSRKNKVVVHNHIPSEMMGNPYSRQVLEDIVEAGARICGRPRRDMIVAFSPSLNSAFVTKLSKCGIVWDFLKSTCHDNPHDVSLLEVPVEMGDSLAMAVAGRKNEPEKIAKYRTLNGIEIDGPFIAVDNRTMRSGSAMRDITKAYIKLFGGKIKSPDQKATMAMMKHMADMDMSDANIVDFFCDREDLSTRREIKKLLKAALQPSTAAPGDRMQKSAQNMGLGIQVNDWWQIGLQEQLNRAQHTNPKPKKTPDPASEAEAPKPFNLRKFREKQKHTPYETMLQTQHDKDMSAQKTMEQLLREGRQ